MYDEAEAGDDMTGFVRADDHGDDEVDHEIDAVGRQFAHFRAKTETLPLNAERQARDGTCRTVSRGRRTRRECDRAG